ncbi:Concanavalin A-like lectin/glucanases superfamily protein [Cyclobacterium lianum]|uniref:Concanavalin A-like lectin/glucanases superfamily protein n=2 Tax=Cyclobacterium lianum TaxID=388280 RepID=A0A1M7ML87_9BACT|nr:Concanavalin A-like lectin/glucanases superfamily protein [Cyclobacterium lianum]
MRKRAFQCTIWLYIVVVHLTFGRQEPIREIAGKNGLVALWDFKETAGNERMAIGLGSFPLKEMNGPISRIEEGPLSGFSAVFKNEAYMALPYIKSGALNIHGERQGITVMAWVKWQGKTGFVGGMWNEYTDGGKRQYGLFVDLPHYNGANQVCGHVSASGGPTPPFPYSCDYSASKQELNTGNWHFIAFTYDGQFIKSYLDGEFQERAPEPIKNTKGFPGLPEGLVHSKNPYFFPHGLGDNGSDFTVGAVVLKRGMGNFFNGLIGGIAIFDRALEDAEMREIHRITME